MQLIEEIARHFHNNALGVLGTNLFYSHLPDVEEDTSITILDTGGMEPDKDLLEIEHPTFQIFIRSKTYDEGKTLINSARDILHGVMNQTLIDGGIHYRRIQALSEGGHLGKNKARFHEFSMNFQAEIVE